MIVCVINGPAGCGKTTFLNSLQLRLMGNCSDGLERVRMASGPQPTRYTRAGIQRLVQAGVTNYLIDDCTSRDIDEAEAVAFAEGSQFCRDLTLYMVRNS